jgi:RNA polymerase sigma factor (TIGR02999 family)
MTPDGSAEITLLLKAWAGGDQAALDQLTPRVYAELHRTARRAMRNQPAGHTLQPTALVNELFIRLVNTKNSDWRDRIHFFAVSAAAMRQILVDSARARRAEKRGGRLQRVAHSTAIDFDELPDMSFTHGAEFIALDGALNALAAVYPRQARVIELRFFGGLSVEEAAEFLNLSPQSVMRDWKLAKAWLIRELNRKPPGPIYEP